MQRNSPGAARDGRPVVLRLLFVFMFLRDYVFLLLRLVDE